jgi:hypothetical protein
MIWLARSLLWSHLLIPPGVAVCSQIPDNSFPQKREDPKLPSGKSQKDAILEADHEKNLEDAERLVQLTTGLKKAIEKKSVFVLSLDDLKKLEEIEKLTRRIRGRLRRF